MGGITVNADIRDESSDKKKVGIRLHLVNYQQMNVSVTTENDKRVTLTKISRDF
jgi:hypothetical protein